MLNLKYVNRCWQRKRMRTYITNPSKYCILGFTTQSRRWLRLGYYNADRDGLSMRGWNGGGGL